MTLPPTIPNHDLDDEEATELIASLRSVLLNQDIERLDTLERQINEYRIQHQSLDQSTTAQVEDLLVQLRSIQERIRTQSEQSVAFRSQVSNLRDDMDLLQRKAQEDAEGIVERLNPVMSNLVRRTIHDSPDEMAEALGPIMGEAILVQIRDSRQDMVNALYPIIGETVQRAVTEMSREFQRNIDKQLKKTFGASGFFNHLKARLRGVSAAELALRDSLPFELKEIFIVQRGSGLLLAHNHPGSEEIQDSELIVAMLTAIRDFVNDSFIKSEGTAVGLDEIQYGDLRIIIESGKYAYIAVVIKGVEPEGSHAMLNTYISELHVRFANGLRDYNGDPALLPNLQPSLAQLVLDFTGEESTKALTRGQKLTYWLAGLGATLLSVLACFYLQFTVALYPIAFPPADSTQTFTPTATCTLTPTPTITSLPPTKTLTPTGTPPPTITYTPTYTPTSTLTFTPTATPLPVEGSTIGNIWVSDTPDDAQRNWIVLIRNTHITVLAVYDDWYQISWETKDGVTLTGWVRSRWIETQAPVPEHFITPTP